MKRSPLLIALGNRIRELRTKKGWTQEYLAEKTDVDRTYIGGIERGIRNVSTLNLGAIAKALNVKIQDLFDF